MFCAGDLCYYHCIPVCVSHVQSCPANIHVHKTLNIEQVIPVSPWVSCSFAKQLTSQSWLWDERRHCTNIDSDIYIRAAYKQEWCDLTWSLKNDLCCEKNNRGQIIRFLYFMAQSLAVKCLGDVNPYTCTSINQCMSEFFLVHFLVSAREQLQFLWWGFFFSF